MIGQNIKNIITTNFVKFNGGGEGTQNGGSKYEFIYYLRIFSCILIILKHVSGSALDYFYDKNVYESINYIVLSSINNILWFAINIFFMITGYIFLSKNKKCTYTTIIKNIIKIFIYLIVFGIIFSFLLKIIGGRRLYSLSDFSNKIVNGELNIIDIFLNSIKDVIAMKNQWGHMWFMYEILKIYLLLPIIKSFVDSQKNNIYILFIIALTFNLIIPFYSNIYQISIYNFFPVNFSIIMVLLGGIINRLNINIKNSAKFILLITFIIIIAKYISNNIINDNVAICNTKSGVSIVLAIIVFLLFMSVKKINNRICIISELTLVAYLIHPLYIHTLYGIIKFNVLKYNLLFSIPIAVAYICISSFLTAYVINIFIKKIGKIINLFSGNTDVK